MLKIDNNTGEKIIKKFIPCDLYFDLSFKKQNKIIEEVFKFLKKEFKNYILVEGDDEVLIIE